MKHNVLTTFCESTSLKMGKAKFKFEKNKPEIYLALGILGFVGTIILASKETLEATKILDDHEKMMSDIKKAEVIDDIYKEERSSKEKAVVLAKTTGNLVKNYAPAMALGAVSLAFILESNNIMNKRYRNALAACSALSEVFKQYRGRVREELGEEMDRHFRYGTEKTIVEKEVVDEKGKKKKVKEEVEVLNGKLLPSDFARYFDESSREWDPDPFMGRAFLRAQCAIANQILQSRGYIFLNEVYDMLGYEQTQMGAIVGWIKDGDGDGYVDFGIFDEERDDVRRFVNGKENTVLLDFNIDGEIWNKI